MNAMQKVNIEKLTLKIGAGKEQTKLEKGVVLIKKITGRDPVKTITNKRIPAWGVRPGLPIGCMITLRKQPAKELLLRLLKAKENKLKESQFDNSGNVSFGIHEYIDIPGVNYDPTIGVLGLQVCLTLEKPGYRIKKRKIKNKKLPKKHTVTKQEAMEFIKNDFKVEVVSQ
jgi:large subunit ribosomal protein L5